MSDTSEIQMHNTPERGGISISPVGTEPKITYHVDWREMGQPSPKLFHDIQDVQVTLATRGEYIDNENVQQAYDTAMDAVNTLLREMVEARSDDLADDQAKHGLYMGNLQELPEVTREVEQVPAGESDE